MKKIFFTVSFILISMLVFSQSSNILWEHSFGGSGNDSWPHLFQDTDGNLLTMVWSNSSDGDFSHNDGNYDIWAVKTNPNGDTLFTKSYGSYADDLAIRIIASVDTGYIVACTTNDTTVTSGGYDIWLMKLNLNGDIIWSKYYGGSEDEFPQGITATADSCYIIAASSKSSDGDLSGNQGDSDAWVFKIDASGTIIWSKQFAGTDYDKAITVNKVSDGGSIVSLYTKSSDGDFPSNFGEGDIWLKKLDSNGNTLWTKHWGGNNADFPKGNIEFDGYIYSFGYSYSSDSVFFNHGKYDIFMQKRSSAGSLIWTKFYGGSESEDCRDVVLNDGKFVVIGQSKSNDGDIANNYGEGDVLVLCLDTAGNIIEEKNFGGSSNEGGTGIVAVSDSDYVFCAYTASSNYDVSNNHGSNDLWLAKIRLDSVPASVNNLVKSSVNLFPNPTTGIFNVDFTGNVKKIQIFDALGKKIIETNQTNIDLSSCEKGLYLVVIQSDKEIITQKIILK